MMPSVLTIKQYNKTNKSIDLSRLIISLISTFAWGISAHSYGFFNGIYTHDGLNAIFADFIEEKWKIELGRFFVPVYRALVRNPAAAPWLIGILSLTYIAAAVFLISKIFDIKKTMNIVLISGLLTTNLTVIALTATYLYELDIDMFAMLLSIISVYLWHRYRWGFIAGAFTLTCSIGLYQSYFAMSFSLIVLTSMVAILRKNDIKAVLIRGLKGAAMLVISLLSYVLLLKTVNKLLGIVPSESYNAVGNAIKHKYGIRLIVDCYKMLGDSMCKMIPHYSYRTELSILIILSAIFILCSFNLLKKNNATKAQVVIYIILSLIFPLALNSIYILSGGMVHDLMKYSHSIAFVAFFTETFFEKDKTKLSKRNYLNILTVVLTIMILYGNIVSANVIYTKKDLDQRAVFSRMIQIDQYVNESLGASRENYPLAMIGKFDISEIDFGKDYSEVTGVAIENSIPRVSKNNEEYNTYRAHYKYILHKEAVFCSNSDYARLCSDRRVIDMQSFPSKDCVKIIDGIIVVKVGEIL